MAERVLRADDWAYFRAWAHRTLPGDHPLVRAHIADLSRPGALTASLNWYRANIDPVRFLPLESPTGPVVDVPVLGVWGDADVFLSEEQMQNSARYASEFRFERIVGSGHWIPVEASQRCTDLLLQLFGD